MKLILLMVLFSTPNDPTPHMMDGYGPRKMSSVEMCLTRRSHLQSYIEANAHPDVKAKVFCTVTEIHGYDEALSAFQAELGDPV